MCATAEVDGAGRGLVAFASFAFADRPGTSCVVVPETILSRSPEGAWLTTVRSEGRPAAVQPVERVHTPGRVRFADDTVPAYRYRELVRAAVRRIAGGDVEKVVLARDRLAVAERDIDPRYLLRRLASANPGCWTFCVRGLVGSTPEMLLRRTGGRIFSRVLAGTGFPGRWPAGTGAELSESSKDRSEHEYAVRSVLSGLAPFARRLAAPERPAVLDLSAVTHLATDVHGELTADAPTLLAMVGALHPSAAVGGVPTAAALDLISRLEPRDRGRYAGPVGWFDAAGDGEFGIALRCGQLAGPRVRLFAGCGVVAHSDPDTEVAEAGAKLRTFSAALSEEAETQSRGSG